MARKLDPKIAEVLKKHGFGPEACWDCHGTWVIYHNVLEQIAAIAGITFDPPQILEADGGGGVAALCVVGSLGDRSIWSTGEASPKNNKNSYCWAMAEKRAIDRVILKLIGLQGLAYSEEESDNFKPPQEGKPHEPVIGALNKTELTKRLRLFNADLWAVEDIDSLECLLHHYRKELDQARRDLPSWWDTQAGSDASGIEDQIKERRAALEAAQELAGGDLPKMDKKPEDDLLTLYSPDMKSVEKVWPRNSGGAREFMRQLETACAYDSAYWRIHAACAKSIAEHPNMKGRLKVDDEPIAEMVDRLAKEYGGVTLADPDEGDSAKQGPKQVGKVL